MVSQAVVGRSGNGVVPDAEYQALVKAQRGVTEGAQTSNMRLKALEDHAKMESLAAQLDFSRIVDPQPLIHSGRTLIKEGRLELLKLGAKGKISKRSKVHVFLFTDMLLYAKSTGKQKQKQDPKYVVYKQVHRSLIQATTAAVTVPASRVRSANTKGGYPGNGGGAGDTTDSSAIELVIFGPDGAPTNLLLMCKSTTEKNRWLSVLDPIEGDDDDGNTGGTFEEWDCPQARATQDWNARQPDELSLKRGDILNIVTRGGPDDMSKGVLIRVAQATTRETRGWFPTTCIKEIVSLHQKAKVFKAIYKLKHGGGGK